MSFVSFPPFFLPFFPWPGQSAKRLVLSYGNGEFYIYSELKNKVKASRGVECVFIFLPNKRKLLLPACTSIYFFVHLCYNQLLIERFLTFLLNGFILLSIFLDSPPPKFLCLRTQDNWHTDIRTTYNCLVRKLG